MRYKRLQSTNKTAYRLADDGAEEWTVIISEIQTKGRGRRGRIWKSPKGGLWLSVVLRPRIRPEEASILQFLGSNACRRAIENSSGIGAKTKWPNDLILDSRKLGGILVEIKLVQHRIAFAIMGIGINVNLGPQRLPVGAISLSEYSGRVYDVEAILKAFLRSLAQLYQRPWDPSQAVREWWENCIHKGKLVEVETEREVVKGMNTGIDELGHLIVQADDGKNHSLVEGTLTVLDP